MRFATWLSEASMYRATYQSPWIRQDFTLFALIQTKFVCYLMDKDEKNFFIEINLASSPCKCKWTKSTLWTLELTCVFLGCWRVFFFSAGKLDWLELGLDSAGSAVGKNFDDHSTSFWLRTSSLSVTRSTFNPGSALTGFRTTRPWWTGRGLLVLKTIAFEAPKVSIIVWNYSYVNCGCRWKWRMIIAVIFSGLSNWKEEGWKKNWGYRGFEKKKSGLQQDSSPWPLRYRYHFHCLVCYG